MKKVMQFKAILSSIDMFVNVFVGLIVLGGVLVTFSKPTIGVILLIIAAVVWLIKVLGFGISFSIIQIAENTSSENSKASTGIDMLEAIHKNKASEFIEIYLNKQSEYEKNPLLKKVFDNIVVDLMLESTSNIEYSIRLMLTENVD